MTTTRMFCAVLLAIVSQSASAAERFVHKEGGFSIQFPDGFQTAAQGPCVAADNMEQHLRVEIEPNKLPGGMTVHEFVKLNGMMNDKILPECKKLKGGTLVTSINAIVPWATVSYKGASGILVKSCYYVFNAKDRRMFIVSCITEADKHEGKRTDFEQMIKSLAAE